MDVLEKFKDLFIDVWTDGIAGVNISEILIAVVIFFFFLFLRGIFAKFVVARLENYVSKSTNKFDNSLVSSMEGPAKFFPIVIGFFISTTYLTLEGDTIVEYQAKGEALLNQDTDPLKSAIKFERING